MFKFSDKRLIAPYILALLGTLIMVISVFLPYASATPEYEKALTSGPEQLVYEELGFTKKSLIDLSMVDFARIYSTYSADIFESNEGNIQMGIVIAIGAFAMISAVFALFKKAIPVAVFSVLSFLIFAFQNFDFTHRGVIPSISYNWGAAYYIFYTAFFLSLIGAVWMLIAKIIIKKENRSKK